MFRGVPCFVSDRHLIYENTSDSGARVEVWDLAEQTRTSLSLPSHFQPAYIYDVLTADLHGDTIALGCYTPSGYAAVLWSLSQDRQLAVVPYGNLLMQVRFSPDGKWLALTGENSTVYLIDTATGSTRHQLQGHISRSWASFTPDGRTALTEDMNGIRFWNLATGRELVKLERSELEAPWLQELEFTHDGKSIYGSVVNSGQKRLKFLTPRSLEEIEEELTHRR
jgi:WD40 repeat protein